MISRIYKDLQEVKNKNTVSIKQKWERDSNLSISDDIWLKHCEFQWKITSSHSWRCFGWKSLCRYFITPAQSSHYMGTSSCWRNCGVQGVSHFHLFWSCPLLKNFWTTIQAELCSIFKMQMTVNWDKLLFGFLYTVDTNKETKSIFGMLSLAARKAITKKWLIPNPPTLDDWHHIVYAMFNMERITFQKRLQKVYFETCGRNGEFIFCIEDQIWCDSMLFL